MKDSEISTILIPRSHDIHTNRETAKVFLDNYVTHAPGSLVMVKYYSDPYDSRNVDIIFAIGVKNGKGRDCYSIISTAELYLINKVSEVPLDVANLINSQRYLCKVNGEWKIEYIKNGTATFEDIKNPCIFRNLEDGFQWFYSDGVLKREDGFVTPEELNALIQELGETLSPATITELSFPAGKIFDKTQTLPTNMQFKLVVSNYRKEDITDSCTVRLYNGDIEIPLEKISKNIYNIRENITNTTTFRVVVLKDGQIIDENFTISIVGPTYRGKTDRVTVGSFPNVLIETEPILWDGMSEFEFTTDLENQITVVAFPSELVPPNGFSYIKDGNSLNYIYDYGTFYTNRNGINYTIYYKLDQVTINNFKQTFGYE